MIPILTQSPCASFVRAGPDRTPFLIYHSTQTQGPGRPLFSPLLSLQEREFGIEKERRRERTGGLCVAARLRFRSSICAYGRMSRLGGQGCLMRDGDAAG